MDTLKRIPVSSSGEPGVGRRQALQILAGAMGAGIAVPGLADGHPLQSHLAHHATIAQADAKAATADGKPAFLDEHQLETLQALAERIVPGSPKANTAEFIDQLLAVDTQANQAGFLSALGAFERRALDLTRRPFVALTPAEQDQILAEASTMESGVPPLVPWTAGSPIATGPAPSVQPRITFRDHFDLIKGWIAGAYYSSEIGMRELGWTGNIFHNEFTGCTHPDGHR
jgi:hypothetical protein